jgi:hypothetical protein
MALNMHTQDGLVDPHESAESPSKERKKKKRFSTLLRPFSLTPKTVPLSSQDNTHDPTPARTAALNLNETLHLILSHIPTTSHANFLRVCKTWNTVVRKIGSYLNPTKIHTNVSNWPYSYPEYAEDLPITFNPLFGRYRHGRRPTRTSREHYMACFQVDRLFYTRNLRKLGDQFLTNPPITHLALTAVPAAPSGAASMLNVRDGIRLRDLAETLEGFVKLNRGGGGGVLRKLAFTVAGLSRKDYEKRGGYSVGVNLFCVKGEGRRVEDDDDLFIRFFGYGPYGPPGERS